MRIWPAPLVTVAVVLTISVAPATARTAPTLGVKGPLPSGSGFGQVRPSKIDYGGDPTSFVVNVKWSSWGGSRAVGHGKALWVWPGWCVACGGVQLPATVVAFGRTTCHGHSAYAYVEWFFPSRGQSFNRRLAGSNICTGKPTPIGPSKIVKCGQVRLKSALATHIELFDSPISCATARQFVAHSGAGQYLHRNARFTVDGWWCGSELSMAFGGLQPVACQRGDLTNLNFELKPA